MGKGMSLEEFRTALSSDATIENEKLKAELKALKEKSETEIAELKEKSEQYEQWCKQLGRRCFVQTCGVMCMNCDIECCDYALTWEDWESITKYMHYQAILGTIESLGNSSKMIYESPHKLE